jgi:hypothetical protein
MSLEIPQIHPRSRTRPYENTRFPAYSRAYRNLLDEDRPILVVARDSPAEIPPFRGTAEIILPSPLTALHLWLNQPLLSLLNKQAGDRLSWSPIWWKDDAYPYGRIILWRDPPRGRRHASRIQGKARKRVSLNLFGLRKAQLWFPVPTITHYAIAHFSPHSHGIVFNPLDGFQRFRSIRSSFSFLNDISQAPLSLPPKSHPLKTGKAGGADEVPVIQTVRAIQWNQPEVKE